MSKKKQKLVVVAHPDDETIFFGGLILSDRRSDWTIVCVTDGNADGKKEMRYDQFRRATKKLGAKHIHFFDLPDIYEQRLDLEALTEKLAGLGEFNEVYTHGPVGEYGHPHHQDVGLAVHRHFLKSKKMKKKVFAVAYNCAPDQVIVLETREFQKRAEILAQIYFSETKGFINFLPAYVSEGFAYIELKEFEAIHAFMTDTTSAAPTHLKKYKWFTPYFEPLRSRMLRRQF